MSEKEDKKEEQKIKLEPIIEVTEEIKTSHKYHDDEDILVNSNLNSKNIKKDLLFFKDELLKDLKREQIKIFEKVEDNEKYALEKIEEFNIKIEKYGEKIINLSNMIITDKTIREKVESLIEYKDKNQEIVTTQGIKIDNLDRDFFNNVYRIDNILKETVIYPGIIGNLCKFKNFHDFIDYVLNQCTQNISFREKTAIDINNLRINDERIIGSLSNKLEKAKKTLNLYIDTCIKKLENKLKEINDTINDRITNYRIESMTYTENMKKATESLLKQVNSVIQAKNDIFNKFDEKMNLVNKENTRMRKYFTGYKNEFNEMRRMFKEMIDALNTKDFSGINRKMKRLSRRQTMMNNDFKVFENNLNKMNMNNEVRPISLNDMFMSEDNSSLKRRFSVRTSIGPLDRERNNPYQRFLKEYKRLDTENKRISEFFEKEKNLTEKKKNEDFNIIKEEPKQEKEKPKKKKKQHKKKEKYLNEIYLSCNNQNNIEFIRRRLNKFNSVCVPNKIFNINILRKVPFEYLNLEKSKPKTKEDSNKINDIKKDTKKLNSNLETIYDIYDTSISKSEKSIFSESSKNSEKSEEKRKDIIKKKYTTNVVIKEKKESDLSNTLNDNESIDQYKLEINKKDFKEDKESKSLLSSIIQNNINENKKVNNKYVQNIMNYDNRNTKEEKNNIKIKEAKSEKGKINSLNKIYITIEGSNPLEINPNSKKNNQNEKNIVNNLKTLMNGKMAKTLTGFPKIVTNNGERIIYSSHPVYKKQKFSSYTNPNILALNYSIQTLYDNNGNKINKTRKSNIETSPDYIFHNKQLLFKMKNSNVNSTERAKKVSFNIFKNTNLPNNLYLSQQKSKEEDKI